MRGNAVLCQSEFTGAALKEAIRLAYEAHSRARKTGSESALEFLQKHSGGLLAGLGTGVSRT